MDISQIRMNMVFLPYDALIAKFSFNVISLNVFSQKAFICSLLNVEGLYFGRNTIWKLDFPWQWLNDSVFIFCFYSEIVSAKLAC